MPTSKADFCRGGDSFGGMYRWVGVVIEIEPGKFMSARIQAYVANVESHVETEQLDFGNPYLITVPVSRTVRIEIEGTLTDQGPVARPDWATEPAGVLDAARRAIGSAEA
jgi:hypothetical protein